MFVLLFFDEDDGVVALFMFVVDPDHNLVALLQLEAVHRHEMRIKLTYLVVFMELVGIIQDY